MNIATRNRFFTDIPVPALLSAQTIREAALAGYDAIVLPPLPGLFNPGSLSELLGRKGKKAYAECIRNGLSVEIGGALLKRLLPRSLYYKDPELFRMDSGLRKKDANFCPTNPDTLRILQENAQRLFSFYEDCDCFHLWLPDVETHSQPLDRWCSCPSCRAFQPSEQLLMALNSCADVLGRIRPTALLSYPGFPEPAPGLKPRENMFQIN